MTIANVQGITAASAKLATGVHKARGSMAASFSSVMNQAGYQKSYSANYTNSAKGEVAKIASSNSGSTNPHDNTTARREEGATEPKKLDTVRDTQKTGTNKTTEQTVQAADDFEKLEEVSSEKVTDDVISIVVSQIQELLQELLGMTDEELDSLMDSMNLKPEDLLAGDIVVQLVMKQAGCETSMDLLNNEELSQMMKNLMESINQLKEQLGQSVSAQEAVPNKEQMEDVVMPEIMPQEQSVSEHADTEEAVVEGVKVTVQSQSQTSADDSSQLEQHSQEQPGNAREMPTEVRGTGNAQTVFENLTQAVSNTQTASYGGATQAMDIVTQIVEEIKTVMKANTTSMELQLHPESLGKVHIQVVAREGIITAQITAQTEAARHAIESQLATLKESFQNQGLKVEAVEVTINPHGFNMEQQQTFDGRQHNSGKSKRQIRLDDMDLEEELTEEESIAVDMMQRAGNQVDFIA